MHLENCARSRRWYPNSQIFARFCTFPILLLAILHTRATYRIGWDVESAFQVLGEIIRVAFGWKGWWNINDKFLSTSYAHLFLTMRPAIRGASERFLVPTILAVCWMGAKCKVQSLFYDRVDKCEQCVSTRLGGSMGTGCVKRKNSEFNPHGEQNLFRGLYLIIIHWEYSSTFLRVYTQQNENDEKKFDGELNGGYTLSEDVQRAIRRGWDFQLTPRILPEGVVSKWLRGYLWPPEAAEYPLPRYQPSHVYTIPSSMPPFAPTFSCH